MWHLALFIAAAPPPAVEVYTVDLGRAVLQTDQGRSIAKTLSALHKQRESEIRASEDKLAERRSRIAPADYAAEVERLGRRIESAERELDAKQAQMLAPELERFEALMADAAKRAKGNVQIVALRDAPLIGTKACDLTPWMAKVAKSNVVTAPPQTEECRFRHFFYVRFDDVLEKMDTAIQAKARLDVLREQFQAQLDKAQKELAEIRTKADETKDPAVEKAFLKRSREVESKFAVLQRQLEQRELQEQSQLYRRIEATLSQLADKVHGVAFVEQLDGAKTKLEPSCDVSSWAAELLNGKATVRHLETACPSFKK